MAGDSTALATKRDLDNVLGSLISQGLSDDQNSPFLRQLTADEWEVSFVGAQHTNLAYEEDDYSVVHRELTRNRAYSAKLLDGGILQLMYRFKKGTVVKHRLAFFPSPNLLPFQDDPESYMRDEIFIDIVSRHMIPFPFRFDFDQAAARDVVHPRCHLTLGDVENCRIPVSAPLTPRWFIDFILRHFYRTEHLEFTSKLPGHTLQFAPTIVSSEESIMHVIVPGCI